MQRPTHSNPRTWLLRGALLLVLLFSLAPGEARASERSFREALKQLFSGDSAERERGEARLRRSGQKALAFLRQWIEETEERLVRAREALGRLDPDRPSDPLVSESAPLRAFFLDRLEQGWRLLQKGEHRRAGEIAQGLLALDGESHRQHDYRRLLLKCRERQLSREVLEPIVEFQERVYSLDQDVQIQFLLMNHRDEIRIIQAQGGILGTLSVKIQSSWMGGGVQQEILEIPVRTFNEATRVVIEPRSSYQVNIPVPRKRHDVEKGLVVRISARGRFRPSQWGIGETNVNETLESSETTCWMVPPGDEGMALSPLRKLEVAILFRDIHGFFTAGQLSVWASENDPVLSDRLVEKLVESLPRLDPFGFQIANRFLLHVTGVPRERAKDREFWEEWLREQRSVERPVESDRPSPPPRSLMGIRPGAGL